MTLDKPVAASSVGPLRVLVIEDEPEIGLALRRDLEELGHTVVGQAPSAGDAIEIFRQERPDLVLLDIRLDGSDGLDLADRLLKERRVPIIVISGFSEPELHERAAAIGVYAYLLKPVTAKALAAQVQVVVRRFRDLEQCLAEKEQIAQTLETRKLVERAKGILMKRMNLAEPDAHRRLQQESQRRRIPMNDLAKKIIESEELLGGA